MKIVKIILTYVFILALLLFFIVTVIDSCEALKDPTEYHFGSEAMKQDFLGKIRYESLSRYLIVSAVETIISLCGIFCFLVTKNKNKILFIRAVAVLLLYIQVLFVYFEI